LCGEDHFSGQNFDHRRGWIADRIKTLAALFAIDIAAYAVMSNHYHIVVRIDRERALDWSVDEVLTRWTALFTGPMLVTKYLSDARSGMTQAEIDQVLTWAETYRVRLYELSWFMRTLNEYIARLANAEDQVKGRFWEGRFKSQALLDEQAVLTAMAYVDLNPIRAGIAETPETSDYTSVQERLGQIPVKTDSDKEIDQPVIEKASDLEPSAALYEASILKSESAVKPLARAKLMPFDATGQTPWAIPCALDDYLEWVDWSGRAVHPAKRGHIPDYQPALLDRLGIHSRQFLEHADGFLKQFGSAIGAPKAMIDLCARRQRKYLRGIQVSNKIFSGKKAA